MGRRNEGKIGKEEASGDGGRAFVAYVDNVARAAVVADVATVLLILLKAFRRGLSDVINRRCC
jgi:hypothetical protein